MPFPMFLLLIVDEIVDKAAIHRRPGHLRRETRGGGVRERAHRAIKGIMGACERGLGIASEAGATLPSI